MEVVWFKNDLRIRDHEPLKRAIEAGPIVCLYILEDLVLNHPTQSGRQRQFRLEAVAQLQSELREWGGELLVVEGEALGVLKRLHSLHPITTVWSHQETGTFASFQRDIEVKHWLREVGIPWNESMQHGVFRRLTNRDGWARLWHREMTRRAFEADLSHARWHPVVETGEMTPVNLPRASYGLISRLWRNPRRLCCTLSVRAGEHYQRAMSSRMRGGRPAVASPPTSRRVPSR